MMHELKARLTAYKYHKAFGKFTDELMRMFGTPRSKPHYVQLKLGSGHAWFTPLDSRHYQEQSFAEFEQFGKIIRIPQTPSAPKVIARFQPRTKADDFNGLLHMQLERPVPVQICGQPFVMVSHTNLLDFDDVRTYEFEWTQDTFLFGSYIHRRSECRRLQHDFGVQAKFGGPEFETEKAKWQDRHHWAPYTRKRPIRYNPYIDDTDLHYDEDEFV